MDRRLELSKRLNAIKGLQGVYFQPPPSIKMTYPCIVYSLSGENVAHADNRRYLSSERYTVTLITRNPDDPIKNVLKELPYTSFDRVYPADNLHHFVYTIYM